MRDGITKGTDPGEPSTGDAYQQETQRFPEHLGLAAEAFLASDFVQSAFGTAVAEQYGLTARYEWNQFLDQVTDWELDRYFEVI